MKSLNIKKRKNYRRILFSKHLLILLLSTLTLWFNSCGHKDSGSPFSFYKVQNQAFVKNDSFHFIKGANYWYGGHIAYTNSGLERLKSELDFMKKHGINNLRIMALSEGDSTYKYRIDQSFQRELGVFNDNIIGIDYLLAELHKRNMTAVMVLGNNWEWSGGFGQYLDWHQGKHGSNILPKTENWNWGDYCKYISQFYSCEFCKNNHWDAIKTVLKRTNSIDGIPYREHPAIFSWELTNEPRPMQEESWESYSSWIKTISAKIKSIDSNHLITIGTEGSISTFQNLAFFKEIYSFNNIDYATIHLWPMTWQWYSGSPIESVSDSTLQKTKNYINEHSQVCKELNKPLVIEEFGLHRDLNGFSPSESTNNRNKYYTTIFKEIQKNKLAGFNFWGAIALPENVNENGFMQNGMSYSADPPQEEQGLYGVYMSDSLTWEIIKEFHP
jgi:mannan endo-1,4-beta-mannosidase